MTLSITITRANVLKWSQRRFYFILFWNDRHRTFFQSTWTINYPKCHDECKDVPMWAVRSFESILQFKKKSDILSGFYSQKCSYVTFFCYRCVCVCDHQTKHRHDKWNLINGRIWQCRRSFNQRWVFNFNF